MLEPISVRRILWVRHRQVDPSHRERRCAAKHQSGLNANWRTASQLSLSCNHSKSVRPSMLLARRLAIGALSSSSAMPASRQGPRTPLAMRLARYPAKKIGSDQVGGGDGRASERQTSPAILQSRVWVGRILLVLAPNLPASALWSHAVPAAVCTEQSSRRRTSGPSLGAHTVCSEAPSSQ